ncbi:MAG: hypothetical protein KDD82_06835 [Planctomycetes bacterium]|nr:hypothetical protein [Planctomycetota bacterium]
MSRDERGAALILVVVVIAALLAIAAPFVISMRLHERSARGFSADVQARHQAEAARNLALNTLLESHPDEERRAREANSDMNSDPEGEDTFDEIKVSEEFEPLSGIGAFETANERGRMAAVEVVDARARIDLNGSTAEPLASLLGATLTTAPLSYSDTKRLEVEDTSAFFTDYDPETVDGFLRVGSEFIAYRSTTPTSFEGLTRGAWFSYSPEPEQREVQKEWIPAGSLVQDGRGFKIAADALWRYLGTAREGELGRFSNAGAVRQIADWDYGALRGAMFLAQYGVTMSTLKQWGVREDDLFDAGLDPYDFDRDEKVGEGASAAQRKALREAERKLEQWKIPEIYVRRFGGDDAVLRFVSRIEAMPRDRKEKQLEGYAKRAAAMRERLQKLEGWLKAETKRQLKDLSEMRDNAPKLEVIGRIELEEKLRPYVTTDAPPEGAEWGPLTVINHPVRLRFDDWAARLTVPDARRFQPGMIVRVQPRDGRPPEYRLCVQVQGRGSGADKVAVFPQLDFDYEARELAICALQPRPLNVNTAPRQVLRAALIGLQSRTGQRRSATGRTGPTIVTPAQAEAIAAAIVDDPPANHAALSGLLLSLAASGTIDAHAVDAVFRNAVDPGDPILRRSTMPFCYRTGDVYELTASGFVNDPAGNEVGRHRFREVIQVAPQRDLTWYLDSQADFVDRVFVPGKLAAKERSLSGLHQLFLPGRWANHTLTRPQHLGPFQATMLGFGSRSHQRGEGDVRPLNGREPQGLAAGSIGAASANPQVSAGVLEREDHDTEVDGVALGGKSIQAAQLGHRYEGRADGSFVGQLGPTGIRGWFRFDALPAAGARAYLFDGGEARDLNRVSLYLEGGALVLATRGEALDLQETGGNPRSTQLIYTPAQAFQAQQWYHVAAFFKGSDRGDLALAVDGRFGGTQTLGSRLSAAIDAYTTTIPLEDASGFPDVGLVRIGANRVADTRNASERGVGGSGRDSGAGCEVLEYRKSGNTLQITRTVDLVGQLSAAGMPAGAQVTAIQDLSQRGGSAPSSLSNGARQPLRGSGHQYRVTFQSGTPPQQGQAGFAAGYAHDAGTYAVPYGYQAYVPPFVAPQGSAGPALPMVIPQGGITLRDAIPPNLPCTLVYDPVPGYDPRVDPQPQIVDDVATELPVVWLGAYPDAPSGRQPAGVQNLPGGFPPRGILRVGGELIYYAAIDPATRRFTGCVRGFLGTTAAAHSLFEVVALVSLGVNYPRGYAAAPEDVCPQRPDLATVGRVYLALPYPAAPATAPQEWISVQPALRGMDPRIDLIQQGLMLLPENVGNVDGELLPFLFREMIRLSGNLGQQPGMLPLNDPGNRAWAETGVFLKELLKRQSLSGARNRKGTQRPPAPAIHPPGTELLPTFVLRALDRDEAGPADVVTVTSDELDPGGLRFAEEATVAYSVRADGRDALRGGSIVSFTANVSRPYRQSANARINRWPTGNVMTVPDLTLGAARPSAGAGDAPGGAPGVLAGRIDDLVTTQLLEQPTANPQLTLGVGQTALGPLNGRPNGYRAGVLWANDQEVYAAVDASPAGRNNRSDVTLLRGALGTQPQAHSWETSPWVLTWPAIAIAEGGLGGDRGQSIPIRGGRDLRKFTDGGGYAAVDRGAASPWAGVWPFVESGNNQLTRPEDELARGAFPGAFGSNESQPVANDLLVDLPFRFHDRYADRVSSIEGVFFEATRELPGALITTVEWDESLPSPYCEVKVAVRLDGAPSWSARPASEPGQPGQLYVFDEPRSSRDPNAKKNEVFVHAKRVEVRVYLTFKPGALYNDAWKQPAVVGAVRIGYRQPLRSLRREELVR